MEKKNSIKRATDAELQEENKKKIKAFRKEIYDRLDKGKKNAFTTQKMKEATKKILKGNDNDRTQKR